MFAKRLLINASFNRFHLVNAVRRIGQYVTKVRHEGTADDGAPGSRCREYGFWAKRAIPQDTREYASYHLRLDWLMGFLALGSDGGWFTLLVKLLQADLKTLKLLAAGTVRRQAATGCACTRFPLPLLHASGPTTRLWWMRERPGTVVPARIASSARKLILHRPIRPGYTKSETAHHPIGGSRLGRTGNAEKAGSPSALHRRSEASLDLVQLRCTVFGIPRLPHPRSSRIPDLTSAKDRHATFDVRHACDPCRSDCRRRQTRVGITCCRP